VRGSTDRSRGKTDTRCGEAGTRLAADDLAAFEITTGL